MSETMSSAAALAPLWKRNPILRFFSSITVGMVLLALILMYASILSALPQVRGAIEVTEMEAFRHWLFVTLIALFCATLIVVTITRIRLSWINAGVWTVHTGLILLAGGAAWYFGTKIEGDVLLRSPRIQMFTIGSGNSRQVAELLAAKGENWSNTMPALGGTVSPPPCTIGGRADLTANDMSRPFAGFHCIASAIWTRVMRCVTWLDTSRPRSAPPPKSPWARCAFRPVGSSIGGCRFR
ncbi:MAG: hypothetical protein HZB38_01395 [Planctomycetes bacterium]|nr:hypothetical protein [Planctomycetota bacterium]